MTSKLWNMKIEEVLRAFSADTPGITAKSAQQECMIEAADTIEGLKREILRCDDACSMRDKEIAAVVREREDYNGKHQAACLEIERLREGFRRIQQATLDGTVCDDVAWFYGNETLHDYCERMAELPLTPAHG